MGKSLGVDTQFWENLLELRKATKVQFFFAPEGGPDCELWTAQSFVLRCLLSHSDPNINFVFTERSLLQKTKNFC